VIQHRGEEIRTLCYNKLKNSYTPELVTAGIVISGGTANLQKVAEVVENAFNLHVKIAHPDINGMNGMITRLEDPAFCTAVGLLQHACSLDRDLKQSGFGRASLKDLKIMERIKKIYKDFTT